MFNAAKFNTVIDAPFGKIGFRTEADEVTEIAFVPVSTLSIAPASPLAQRVADQIAFYFDHPGATFDLPLAPVGTPFQRRVRDALCRIPAGDVLTYGELAKELGSVPRAVGQACGSNYFPLVVPCHRVVGSNWIGGFAHHNEEGFFRDVKRWLLAHESAAAAMPLWRNQA